MYKKNQNGLYIDKGPGHSGQFSGDFHKSGKWRYAGKKKRERPNEGIVFSLKRKIEYGLFNKPEKKIWNVKLDSGKYNILSKIIATKDKNK